MLYELRTYRLQPGTAPRYLDLLRREGLPLVTRHLPLLGYWMTETGRLNVIHHLWAYEDWNDRAACRASLATEKAWGEGFIPRAFVDVVAQENLFLTTERTAPAFDAAVAARRTERPVETADMPLFSTDCGALAFSAAPLAEDGGAIAVFRVQSGESPGSVVTLWPARAGLHIAPGAAARHEIIRPLGFSPL